MSRQISFPDTIFNEISNRTIDKYVFQNYSDKHFFGETVEIFSLSSNKGLNFRFESPYITKKLEADYLQKLLNLSYNDTYYIEYKILEKYKTTPLYKVLNSNG